MSEKNVRDVFWLESHFEVLFVGVFSGIFFTLVLVYLSRSLLVNVFAGLIVTAFAICLYFANFLYFRNKELDGGEK